MKEDLRDKLEAVTSENLDEISKLNREDPTKAAEALSKLTKSYSEYLKANWSAHNEEEKREMDDERWREEARIRSEELKIKDRELDIKTKQQIIDTKKWKSVSFDTGAKLIITVALTIGTMIFTQNGGLVPKEVSSKIPKLRIF